MLRSRVVKVVAHPLVAWLLFTAVIWGSHLSSLFDAALEDALVHDLEHGLYLASSMLFWWPVVGRDPSPWRLPYPARIGYLFLQMPLMSLLGVLILFSGTVLYPHYVTTGRALAADAARGPAAGGRAHVGHRRPRASSWPSSS